MRRLVRVLVLLALLAPAARAIKPGPGARADARRFGFDRLHSAVRKTPAAASRRAFKDFNARAGGRWKLRFSERTGLPASLIGGAEAPRSGPPDRAARSFLNAHRDMLGVDADGLDLERQVKGQGLRHLLYRQRYRGLPVEFSAVKVHMAQDGTILGVDSTYEPSLSLQTTPAVSADAASAAAAADAGGGASRGAPVLVVLPLETDGRDHLAWKLRIDGAGAWRYYVDAMTGQVLFRYSVNQFVGCLSSGVVNGMVYDIDPTTTPVQVKRPFNDQYVYVSAPPIQTVTGDDSSYGGGFFCAPVLGKVAMSLRGPYVSVSDFRGRSAHYDDGAGVWSTVATPVSSPHPYANSSLAVSTINISGAGSCANAVEFLPVFSNFQVGGFSGGSGEGTGDITDDDRLTIYDSYDHPVASYIGARGAFNGAAVHGSVLHLALKSNATGTHSGYDVAISSCLNLTNPTQDAAPLSSHTWTTADTAENLSGELNLFYHLNQMHDYFMNDVNKSSAAPIVRPVVAMAHVGPDLANAFYDPDYDDLYFGDISHSAPSDDFTLDATVPHHEYVHYLVEKIWSIQNYGQAGAISEANADYFAASSLNYSTIGAYANLGVPLRELDDQKSGAVNYKLCAQAADSNCVAWHGEIHDDSPFISQALWDIRRERIQALGYAAGRSCADNLVFQALLYFPESFQELYDAIHQVDKLGVVAACGGASAAQGIIDSAFGTHINSLLSKGDAYEYNDGFETAVDVSSIPVVSATISPSADNDFYSFGAGPGLVQVTLTLPASGGGLYKAYQLQLFDASRRLVAGAAPPYNAFGTLDGYCNVDDCGTTQQTVVLSYNNPTGGLLYAQVLGGDSINGSNSGVNSTVPYTLSVSYPRAGAVSGSIVSASFDNDLISFTVDVSSFISNQDWRFAFAQLRDESYSPLLNTVTHVPAAVGDYLTMVSSANANGVISGSVRLAPGFAARFPAAGTVHLEVFGYNVLASTIPAFVVNGSSTSLGLSNPLNLTASKTELTAYNNLLTPGSGQKAVIKYAVSGPGRLTVKLYTVTGRFVQTLYDGETTGGKGTVTWDGRNNLGSVVASGVYVVRGHGPGLDTTQKIVVVK